MAQTCAIFFFMPLPPSYFCNCTTATCATFFSSCHWRGSARVVSFVFLFSREIRSCTKLVTVLPEFDVSRDWKNTKIRKKGFRVVLWNRKNVIRTFSFNCVPCHRVCYFFSSFVPFIPVSYLFSTCLPFSSFIPFLKWQCHEIFGNFFSWFEPTWAPVYTDKKGFAQRLVFAEILEF